MDHFADLNDVDDRRPDGSLSFGIGIAGIHLTPGDSEAFTPI